jgi:pimeloyl-ACP methyl ester carboxylesterase
MKQYARVQVAVLVITFAYFVGVTTAQELRRSGFLGMVVVPIGDVAREQLGRGENGALIQSVVDGSSAKEAGVQAQDVVTQINDHRVIGVDDFIEVAKTLHAGDTATIYLHRGAVSLTKQMLVKPRPVESAPDVDTLYRAVTADRSLRRVIVTVPKTQGRHPAVLYINGIGCFSQESANLQSPDAQLLYGLSRVGFVTMRVEKSGVGDSQGPPCGSPVVDLRTEQRGYLAGLEALKEYPFVDSDNIYLMGISIGGVQAPLIAQQVRVKGIVVVNTVIKPFLEYLIDTRRRQNLLKHVAYDEMERRLRANERCNHRLLIERETSDQILKDTPECGDFISYPAPNSYLQQWAALNLAEEWKKVEAPVLVVYGTSDFVSTIADDPYMVDVINSFHPGYASLRAIPNMEHGLTKAPSMEASISRPAGAPREFEPAVLEAIKEWLQQQTNAHPGAAERDEGHFMERQAAGRG